MTIPAWQPGTTYVPGALVVPRSAAAAPVTTLANPSFDGNTGWTLDAALAIVGAGGYNSPGCLTAQTQTGGAFAFNQNLLAVVPGQTIGVSVMIRHDTGDDHSSDGTIHIAWLDKNQADLGNDFHGTGLPSLSNAGWQQLAFSPQAPAGAAFAKIGVYLFRNGADNIYADYVQLNYTPQIPARAVMYEATQAKPGKSGSTEPIWPPLGSSVTDNEVTWNGVNIDRIVWQASPLLQSGATEPAWPTVPGGAVHDGTIDWVAYTPVITDPNCPHSKIVAIAASHVFAGDKDIVRFCAVTNPLDWTAPNDAGYLATGLQQDNSNDVSALPLYRSELVAFNAGAFQLWQVDPDPGNMAILDQRPAIGTTYPKAAQPVANDLFYLSQLGVRSFGTVASSDNLEAGALGLPIDTLVQAALKTAVNEPLGAYYPALGQYWLIIDNQVFVLTMAEAGQPGAWTRYVLPFAVDARPALLGNDLYLRDSAGNLYLANPDDCYDRIGTNPAAPVTGTVQWNYLDLKAPGRTKRMEGVDVIAQGKIAISIGWDQTNLAAFTAPYSIASDTQPGGIIPIPCAGPSFAVQLTLQPLDDGTPWSLNAVQVYVRDDRGAS